MWEKTGLSGERNNELEQSRGQGISEHTRKERLLLIKKQKDRTGYMGLSYRSGSHLWSPKGKSGMCSSYMESSNP